MQAGVVHGVPGQRKVFVEYPQGVVANVHGFVDLVRRGLQERFIAHTVEQVVVHHHGGPPAVVMTFIALDVVVGIGCQFDVEAWIEG
ncbi:hypothetical protein D3C80_1949670 [compost metagenome]